ncbi:MAG: DUF2905 family protein [Anaerolineales bacterium]
MFQMESLGRWLIILGVTLAVVGGVMLLLSKVPFLNRWGRLPGDIRYRSADGRVTCLVPIVSSILLSLLLTIILNLIIRFLNR